MCMPYTVFQKEHNQCVLVFICRTLEPNSFWHKKPPHSGPNKKISPPYCSLFRLVDKFVIKSTLKTTCVSYRIDFSRLDLLWNGQKSGNQTKPGQPMQGQSKPVLSAQHQFKLALSVKDKTQPGHTTSTTPNQISTISETQTQLGQPMLDMTK